MKETSNPLGFRFGDAVLIAAVLAVAAVLFCVLLHPVEPASVQITWEGGEVLIPLDRPCDRTVHSGGYELTVTIGDGAARITASDCPGKDCMHTGEISRVGRSIVCMPGRVVVKIIGEETSDADWILP